MDTIICDSKDRSKWIINDSLDFGQNEDNRLIITDFNANEFIEVDNNIFVNKRKLEAYEKQCREENEFYLDSDIY